MPRRLTFDDDQLVAAADEGIADIEAGRFELTSSPENMEHLRAELRASGHENSGKSEPVTR